MKAEALVETAGSDSTNLRKAFDLVQVVNKRSMARTASDTLKYETFKTKDDLELLVMAERERELCFEGKRWWDLMRYCYRHMQGVDTRQKLADQAAWPELYQPMLEMVVRKYGSGGEGDAVSYKMKSEPYLYWPLQESETKVNRLLNQNPVFIQEKSTSKN
jgi:malate synthase